MRLCSRADGPFAVQLIQKRSREKYWSLRHIMLEPNTAQLKWLWTDASFRKDGHYAGNVHSRWICVSYQ